MGLRGEVFSSRASSGTRTYFFNVKENRSGDLFLNIVESKKHGEEGFERHQIVVFEEELTEFLKEFSKAAEFMKRNMSGKPKRRHGGDFERGPKRDGDRDSNRGYDSGANRKPERNNEKSPDRDKPRNATVRVRRKPKPESGDSPAK